MTLQYFDQAATATEIAAATRRDGGAIVTGLASPELVDTVAGELRGYFDTHGHKSQNDFTGHQTNRCHVVLEESLASSELVAHDMVISVSDEFLLPYCDNYQIGRKSVV